MGFLDKVFGTHSQREVKRIEPIVDKIEAMRDEMVALSDEALRDKTRQFKERLAEGATLDDILPEAYATVREAARRVLGMEPAGDGQQVVEADVPMAEMHDFTTFIRQVTQGRGSFTFTFARYEEAPSNVAQKVIEEAKNEAE